MNYKNSYVIFIFCVTSLADIHCRQIIQTRRTRKATLHKSHLYNCTFRLEFIKFKGTISSIIWSLPPYFCLSYYLSQYNLCHSIYLSRSQQTDVGYTTSFNYGEVCLFLPLHFSNMWVEFVILIFLVASHGWVHELLFKYISIWRW